MSDPRRALGARGEQEAERVLRARGLRFVARNVRTRFGEIDLVLRDGEGYLFVEVKTRRSSSFVRAVEAVDQRKARRLAALAAAWLAQRGEREAPWRLALVALTFAPDGVSAEVIALEAVGFSAPRGRW